MMSKNNENGISLTTPPAIHVGPIVNPGTNETISIVIPLSAQLATVTSQKIEKSCKDCTKDAKQSSNNVHPRLRNDKTKGCPYPGCTRYGRAFSRAHDAASKIRCDYCSKTFKTKWTLSSHVAAHEGRFQFDCHQCGKKFVRKSHYEGHMRSHEAARPYVCEQCGKTFKELKHRREHTKRKHPTNQNAIQTLLDSISPCVSEELPVDQTKFTLLMPVNFSV